MEGAVLLQYDGWIYRREDLGQPRYIAPGWVGRREEEEEEEEERFYSPFGGNGAYWTQEIEV